MQDSVAIAVENADAALLAWPGGPVACYARLPTGGSDGTAAVEASGGQGPTDKARLVLSAGAEQLASSNVHPAVLMSSRD